LNRTKNKKPMRKYYLIVLFALWYTCIQAQVQIQTTIPTVGLVQKNQLWNLVLLNGTIASIDGRIELIIRDRQTGLDLMSAVTSSVTIMKGANTVNVSRFNPIQYNYLGMEPDRSINGLLPAGAYIACYSFVKGDGDKQELLAEECVQFDVEALSPPMLLFPADSSVLETSPAQFTWTPPTPAALFSGLNYELLITEIRPGQKAAEAMQDNMPFYSTAGIITNLMTYPAALPTFEKDKWYSWQVVARDKKNYAGISESWVFKVKNPDSTTIVTTSSAYVLIKNNGGQSGVFYINDELLRIKYYSYEATHPTIIRLLGTDGQLIQESKQELKYGDNYLLIKLNKAFRSGQMYRVEIANLKETHSALFSITEKEKN